MRHHLSTNTLIVTAVLVAAVTIMLFGGWYYYSVDPSQGAGMKCTFKLLTGYDCPGCGSQRALHAMLHGDVAAAWHFNPMVFVAVPAAVYYLVLEAFRHRWTRLHAASTRPGVIIAIVISIIVYWIGRNL